MRSLGMYKDEHNYIFNPLSTIKTGGLIGSNQFLKIAIESSSELIYKTIETVLNQCKENVHSPSDWRKFFNESTKALKSIGINSISDLNKKGNKYCSVRIEEKRLEIIPSKNDITKKYFGLMPDLAEHVQFSNNYDEVLESILKTFAKCT